MKKMTALALALMLALSMATAAFAANPVPDYNPGKEIDLVYGDFSFNGLVLNGGNHGYFTADYFTVSRVEYDKGKDLVASVKFDGDGNLEIKLKQNYALEAKSISNLIIRNIVLTARKDTNLTNGTNTVTKSSKIELTSPLEKVIGFQVEDEVISSSMSPNVDDDKIIKFIAGDDYGTASFRFFGGDIYAEVRVYKNEKFNLTTSTEANKDIVRANPEAELSFYSFPAAPAFSNNATVEISAEKGDYLYEIKDGKLVTTNFKWKDDLYAFTGKTRVLGRYVVSDEKLRNVSSGSDASSGSGSTPNISNPPNTGANDVVGVAVALAAVALVAAGALSVKKR